MWRPAFIIIYLLLLATVLLRSNQSFDREYAPSEIAGVSIGFHPGFRVWQNAKLLWQNGTLERADYFAVSEYLRNGSISNTKENPVWQDLYAISVDGRFYPKHQQVITGIAALCYGIFGDYGAWILNTLALCILGISLYYLSGLFASPNSSLLLVMFLPWIEMEWIRYSIHSKNLVAFDMIGATFIIGGYAISRVHPLIGGLLLGLSLNIRVSWTIYSSLPFASFLLSKRKSAYYTAGLATTFLAVALFNYSLFGDPLRGPYSRLPHYIGGQLEIDTNSHTFSLYYLREIFQRLFSRDDGWITSAPYLILVAIILAMKGVPPQLRRTCIAAMLLGAPHFIYGQWFNCSGTRFLMPTTLILSLPLAWALDRFLERKIGPAAQAKV